MTASPPINLLRILHREIGKSAIEVEEKRKTLERLEREFNFSVNFYGGYLGKKHFPIVEVVDKASQKFWRYHFFSGKLVTFTMWKDFLTRGELIKTAVPSWMVITQTETL